MAMAHVVFHFRYAVACCETWAAMPGESRRNRDKAANIQKDCGRFDSAPGRKQSPLYAQRVGRSVRGRHNINNLIIY